MSSNRKERCFEDKKKKEKKSELELLAEGKRARDDTDAAESAVRVEQEARKLKWERDISPACREGVDTIDQIWKVS